jgi:hypothetical protein
LDREIMTPSSPSQPTTPAPDYAALWSSARKLYPIYLEMAREFAVEAPGFSSLDEPADSPDKETVEQAQKWLNEMDERIQVHQLRQFLQTNTLVDNEGVSALIQHVLGKTPRVDSARDKIDFLLVQYFSQKAPTELGDSADIAYVAQALEPLLGTVELKTPVWLNALDRALDAVRKCKSLDELLHGGVLEQGRKAKAQAGDLFYMPIALVAFTRFGYLMRRAFFRLMLTDLNNILDGLTELEEKCVETIDCRRAQFSAQEPIVRLRMICQSWKVMFQAEYSSGQPLRMLVDLRASVDAALGRGSADEGGEKSVPANAASKAAPAPGTKPKAAAASAGATKAVAGKAFPAKTAVMEKAVAAKNPGTTKAVSIVVPGAAEKPAAAFEVSTADAPEFEISAVTPEWNPEEDGQPKKK